MTLTKISTEELQNFWTDFFTNYVRNDSELCQYEIQFNNTIPNMYKVFIKINSKDTGILQKINAKSWSALNEQFDATYDKQIVFFESEINPITDSLSRLVLTINF